jgi:hypothetical protein
LTTIKIDNIIVYEKARENRDGGGGLALGCVKDLKTVLMKIRCCVAYGPKKFDSKERKQDALFGPKSG